MNDNEAVYGNEVKRRRINQVGDHLKVWQVCNVEYMPHDEKEKEEKKPAQEPVYEVQVQDQEPVQPVQYPPVHLIGRTVVIETTGQRICRGTLQCMFELNGERAIHIQTSDGENLIYTASQICGLELLNEEVPVHYEDEEEEVVVQIDSDDDEEVQELTRHMQHMEVVQIDSDSDENSDENNDDNDSDATTQQLEDEDEIQDDFPDVEFQPSRQAHQEQDQQDQQEEDNCCAICLDSTDPARNFVSLNCGHQFHFACIMGNMSNGGHNRNQCPMCRNQVIDGNVHSMDALHQELSFVQQHREELSVEYARVMGMQLQINIRYHEEREARDALERRAYICGLNERIAAVVVNAANNDIRRQNGAAAHAERQIRDLCMSFGMMAFDAQYDYVPEYPEDPEYPEYPEDPEEDRID